MAEPLAATRRHYDRRHAHRGKIAEHVIAPVRFTPHEEVGRVGHPLRPGRSPRMSVRRLWLITVLALAPISARSEEPATSPAPEETTAAPEAATPAPEEPAPAEEITPA